MSHRWFTVAAAIGAVAGTMVIAFAPLARVEQETTTPEGEAMVRSFRTTVVSEEGLGVMWLIALPVLISLLAFMGGRTRWVRGLCAVLLWGFSLVSIWSVGLYFIPAALLMTVAAVADGRDASTLGAAPG